MKKLHHSGLLIIALLATVSSIAQGYEIRVVLKPFVNQWVYLGHYSGKQYPILDSVKLDGNSSGVFRGKTPLGGGIYLLAYPQKNRFVEFLVDKQQRFSVSADTLRPDQTRFTGSPDNDRFIAYQSVMNRLGKTLDSIRTRMRAGVSAADSIKLTSIQTRTSAEVSLYRKGVIAKDPNSLLSVLFHLMEEPKVPPAEQQPGGRYDSAFAYRYFKDHYWDGVNFWDDRVSRTPAALFEDRVDKYFNTLVYPAADSVRMEIDRMLAFASPSKEMTRILLVKFATRYLNMKYMWEDAVFVHLYEKYFANKEYDWLTPSGKKLITDRAYSLMANIMGNQAENIILPDSLDRPTSLYADITPYTVVVFWDPTCGHCKETLPVLDSMYQAKWKNQGVQMYAVAKETDGTRQDWLTFVRAHGLRGWTNVYYSKTEDRKRIDANIPGYTQLYDAQVVPAIYLLDKDKRIVAKKLTWQQIDDILQLKVNKP